MAAEEKKIIKANKPKPYQIEGIIEFQAARHPLNIIYLSTMGVIAHVENKLVRVGESYMVNFSVPGSDCTYYGKMRVFKTYDKAVDPRTHKVERMAELHFASLTAEQKANILGFAKAHGQK